MANAISSVITNTVVTSFSIHEPEKFNKLFRQYGKQHFGAPLAPNKLDSLPVDQLVKMVFYFEDTTIKTMADVRQRYGAQQSQ